MPKPAHSLLAWSAEQDVYELREGTYIVPLFAATWAIWLDEHGSFAFAGRQGRLTLLKERRKAGPGYWYAYRRQGGHTAKRYAGRSGDLTFTRLEELAQMLGEHSERPVVPQPPARGTPHEDSAGVITPEPLLVSKLMPPHLHHSLVRRTRLLAQLDAGCDSKLILVSAPAGFGKTTLVRQWLDDTAQSGAAPVVAWLSLDRSDNDLLRFWRYLINACRVFGHTVGSHSLALLEAPISLRSPMEMIVTAFVNELAQTQGTCLLVLEDYHVITAPLIHAEIVFLLDHLPPHLHLLLITRTDPPLPLARWRATGELTEIDTPDLRFSDVETATFLQGAITLVLPSGEISQVVSHIEGWAAGLRLLALALQGRQEAGALRLVLANFVAGRRGISDYFVAEVLNNQSAPLQLFLLHTSFLGSLTAALCDSVTARSDSQTLLELLEQANLFLEPLDGSGLWYRYHALFATAMQGEARRRLGETAVRDLLDRAGRWYELHAMLTEAIEAAFVVEDMPRAADLLERVTERQFSLERPEMHGPPEFYTLHLWLTRLPPATRDDHPLLNMALAIAMMFTAIIEMRPTIGSIVSAIDLLLVNAERGFTASGATGRLGQVYAVRALVITQKGEIRAGVGWARAALDLLPPTELYWRSNCITILGRGEEHSGHLGNAAARFAEAYALCETLGNRPSARANTAMLGWVYLEQNELHRAATLFRQILNEARASGDLDDVDYALHGLAEIALCWNDLDAAWIQAEQVMEATGQYPHESLHIHAVLILARVEGARGHSAAALARCAALLAGRPPTLIANEKQLDAAIAFEQGRLALAAGDLAAAQRWRAGRLIDPERSQIALEREETLLARILIAEGDPGAAVRLLEPVLTAVEQDGHARVALEMRVALALAYAACDQVANARQTLVMALAEAQPANTRRVFVDGGEPLAALLRALLPTLGDKTLVAFVKALLRSTSAMAAPATLAAPLSQQERRVLRLIAAGSSNVAIATNLVVSVNTVKAHVKAIYRKLLVSSRLEAASVARDMELL